MNIPQNNDKQILNVTDISTPTTKNGVIDTTGKWIIPAKYDQLYFANDSLFIGKSFNLQKSDLLNDKGEVLASYHDISNEVKGLLKVTYNKKESFIDSKQRLLFPFQYSFANIADTSRLYFILVSASQKYLVDIQGKSVLPEKYEWLDWADKEKGHCLVRHNDKQGIIDLEGREVVPAIYNNISQPKYSLNLIDWANWKKKYWLVNLNGKYGLIDKQGKDVVPCRYNSEGYCEAGYYVFPKKKQLAAYRTDGSLFNDKFSEIYEIAEEPQYRGVCYHRRYGVIDSANHWLIAPTFKKPIRKWTQLGEAMYIITTSKKPIIEQQGYINPQDFAQIAFNRQGKILAEKSEGSSDILSIKKDKLFVSFFDKQEFSIIDSTGKTVNVKGDVELLGEAIIAYKVKNDGSYSKYIIDNQGNKLSDIYDNLNYNAENSFFIITTEAGKNGAISAQGKNIIPPIYDCFDLQDSLPLIKVCIGGKIGFINPTGKIVIPIQYEEASNFVAGMCVVSMDSKVGCIDSLGNIVLPLQYDGVQILGKNLFAINQNCLWQLIRRNGEVAYNEMFSVVAKYLPQSMLFYDKELTDKPSVIIDTEQLKIIDTGNEIFLIKDIIPITKQKKAYIFYQKGLYGLVSLDFAENILPCEYNRIESHHLEELVCFRKYHLWGLMAKGKIAFTPQFETINIQSKHLFNTQNRFQLFPYCELRKGKDTLIYYYKEGDWLLK